MTGKPKNDPGFDLAGHVKRIRAERGLTHRQIADSTGLSATWISNVELGKIKDPGVYSMFRLALALRVPMEELMGVSRLSGRLRINRDTGKTVAELLQEYSTEPIPSEQEEI